ncbi:hypothetical protein Hanom_Chr09g00829671 [Helianthus anomalus]
MLGFDRNEGLGECVGGRRSAPDIAEEPSPAAGLEREKAEDLGCVLGFLRN